MQLPKLDATTPEQAKALVTGLLQNAEQQLLTALLNVTMNAGHRRRDSGRHNKRKLTPSPRGSRNSSLIPRGRRISRPRVRSWSSDRGHLDHRQCRRHPDHVVDRQDGH